MVKIMIRIRMVSTNVITTINFMMIIIGIIVIKEITMDIIVFTTNKDIMMIVMHTE